MALFDRGDIVSVQNAEVFFQTQRFAVLTQHAHAQSMEGADHHFLCFAPHQLFGPFTHFSSGFVGERDGGDALRGQTKLNQVRNFVGDDAGLARTGTGQHQTRALYMVNRFELGEIEGRRHGSGERGDRNRQSR